MYIVETRIKTRGNKTIWMPYKQYRTTNGIENFQKRHESYGYGMTINKFYEVIALSPSGKTCTIQPIRKITIKGDAYSPYGSEVVPQTEGEDRFCGEPRKGKRIQIGTYAKARAYVKISSYGDAYKMDEKDFERGYYENHLD